MRYTDYLGMNLPEDSDKALVAQINANFIQLDGDIKNIDTEIENLKQGGGTGGGSAELQWELLGSKTLTAETAQENTNVKNYKANLKGLRVKVIVPPDTGFSSNLISCQFALNNSRSFVVRANNITRITTQTPMYILRFCQKQMCGIARYFLTIKVWEQSAAI